jgi:hypothetical protein
METQTMLHEEYRAFLRRAERARSVKELRIIATEAMHAFPGDADAELLDQTCFTFATALIERQAERRPARYLTTDGSTARHLQAV